MSVNSAVEICNLALGHLGSFDTVEDITSPVEEVEKVMARWYPISRRYALRIMIPNFAKTRRLVAKKVAAPAFGYSYAYSYPSDAVRVLGFGDIDEKDLSYNIETDDATGLLEIQTDMDFTGGMKLRFVKDVTDVTKYTPDFVMLLSYVLAKNTALSITQDRQKAADATDMLKYAMAEVGGISSQENPPIRISNSKAKQARYGYPVQRNNVKK